MAKRTKVKNIKRRATGIKRKRSRLPTLGKGRATAKKSKTAPGLTDQILDAVQVVTDAMADVAKMRREAKKRTPMDEG
jgi:hypothetical protein